MAPLHVLHLAGSAVSDFYHDLSLVYARDVVAPAGTRRRFAVVEPGGRWRIGPSIEALSPSRPLGDVLPELEADVVVPHMFCLPGMTSYRAFVEDMLGLPLVGSSASTTAIAARKDWTRQVASGAGVRVAEGELLRRGETTRLAPPVVVKPNAEDNSIGLSLVRDPAELPTALRAARAVGADVLVEAFVPGREIRVAVVERGDELYVPAMIEYLVSDAHPIRAVRHKLHLDASGRPEGQTRSEEIGSVCPARVDPDLASRIASAARAAHRAIGARHYSLFDFRIHAETGEPHLLEAGLFWSFSPVSMISRMLASEGNDLEAFASAIWHRAASASERPALLQLAAG